MPISLFTAIPVVFAMVKLFHYKGAHLLLRPDTSTSPNLPAPLCH